MIAHLRRKELMERLKLTEEDMLILFQDGRYFY